jgi:hypothetical protein
VGFFAHHSHAATSHKEKKMQKKILLPTAHDAREKRDAAKKEKRKKRKEEKEEGRPRCRAAGHRDPPLGLAGRGFFFFFLFGDLRKDLAGRMKPTAGSCWKDLARDQTPRGRPTGHRDPRLGLAGRGFVFFFFFFFLPV